VNWVRLRSRHCQYCNVWSIPAIADITAAPRMSITHLGTRRGRGPRRTACRRTARRRCPCRHSRAVAGGPSWAPRARSQRRPVRKPPTSRSISTIIRCSALKESIPNFKPLQQSTVLSTVHTTSSRGWLDGTPLLLRSRRSARFSLKYPGPAAADTSPGRSTSASSSSRPRGSLPIYRKHKYAAVILKGLTDAGIKPKGGTAVHRPQRTAMGVL
jgi:hypothetical protein